MMIFSLDDFDEAGHLLQVVTIPPDTRQRMHSHGLQTEVFYILEGQATITINQVDYLAGPGDAFICSPGDLHNIWNKSKENFHWRHAPIPKQVTLALAGLNPGFHVSPSEGH